MASSRVQIPRIGATEAPLSFSQEGHRFLSKLAGGTLEGAKNLTLLCRVDDPDVAALRRAIDQVMMRHEVLRIALRLGRQEWQIVSEDWDVPLSTIKVDGPSLEDRLDAAGDIIDAEFAHDFDYSSGCLVRACLIEVEGFSSILVVTIDHLSADPQALGLLHRELNEAYTAFRDDLEPDLPDLPIQYTDFALWQNSEDNRSRVLANKEFWQSYLSELPAVDLPFANQAEKDRWATQGGVKRFIVPRDRTASSELLRAMRLTPAGFILAAVYCSLIGAGASDDITVATLGSYRSLPETKQLIGTFANICFLRFESLAQAPLRDLSRHVQSSVLTGLQHSGLAVSDLLSPEVVGSINRGRYPWIVVNYRETLDPEPLPLDPMYPGEIRRRSAARRGTTAHPELETTDIGPLDLHFRVLAKGDEYHCEMLYSTSMFERPAIEDLAGRFAAALQLGTDDIECPAAALGRQGQSVPVLDPQLAAGSPP